MEVLYRVDMSSSTDDVSVHCYEERITKETPKGYWILYGTKWVAKEGKKRYAYPTKDEAIESFIKRKERQIKILERQLSNVKIALSGVLEKPEELKNKFVFIRKPKSCLSLSNLFDTSRRL